MCRSSVLISLVLSAFLGFAGGLALMVFIIRVFFRARPGTVRRWFGKFQMVSAGFMAFSHGSNDGQKFIGVFTLSLLLGGAIPQFNVPAWVIVLCAATMGIGTAVGGWPYRSHYGVEINQAAAGTRLRSRDVRRADHHSGLRVRHPR